MVLLLLFIFTLGTRPQPGPKHAAGLDHAAVRQTAAAQPRAASRQPSTSIRMQTMSGHP